MKITQFHRQTNINNMMQNYEKKDEFSIHDLINVIEVRARPSSLDDSFNKIIKDSLIELTSLAKSQINKEELSNACITFFNMGEQYERISNREKKPISKHSHPFKMKEMARDVTKEDACWLARMAWAFGKEITVSKMAKNIRHHLIDETHADLKLSESDTKTVKILKDVIPSQRKMEDWIRKEHPRHKK
jgi:hypothetical protein